MLEPRSINYVQALSQAHKTQVEALEARIKDLEARIKDSEEYAEYWKKKRGYSFERDYFLDKLKRFVDEL